MNPPDPAIPPETRHTSAVRTLVEAEFSEHPGRLGRLWVPTTAQQASDWLDEFLQQRLRDFGRYEDALTRRSSFVFHSGLSPLLNVGLLTPEQVLDRTLTYASLHQSPINSVEGLVRQIVGWRETSTIGIATTGFGWCVRLITLQERGSAGNSTRPGLGRRG
jgi:deoxyribodipyrimidine photolyase-related protein